MLWHRQYAPIVDAKAPIAADKARVIIVRPWKYIGAARGLEIKDGEKKIGFLGTSGYLCWERDAGKCTVASEKTQAPEFDAKPGETYYFRAGMHGGMAGFGEDIEPIDAAEGAKLVSKAHPGVK